MTGQVQLDALSARIAGHHPGADTEPVRSAFAELARLDAAADAHAATEAAALLADMRLDPPTIAATLLAPLAAAGTIDLDDVGERWGAEVRTLLEGVARLLSIRWDRIEEHAAESLRKMFLAMAQDIRVVLIVLAMRVQRMRVLLEGGAASLEEARQVARETLEVFAPLANRLGIWQMKWELEDSALRVLEPATFAELERLLAERREERTAFVDQVKAVLDQKLREEGIDAHVNGRPKHVYSIYKKMQRKQVSFDRIYDVSAVRVITDRVPDCYAALGVVHSLWVPLPHEFDDYIARPKDNGYQSLHTAVMGPGGRPVEIQIRTHEMHEFAEFGVAAHWAYKERRKTSVHDKFMLLRRLMDWERDLADPHGFIESLKTDVFKDQVYVFTPKGDIVDLAEGSTPLDFAYRVHTMVGHRCKGARVNDQIVPLDYQLKTGDRIDVLTHKEPQPSRDWMNPAFGYLKTASARGKVRTWFRQQDRDTAIAEGRAIVERELHRLELSSATVEQIAEALKYKKVEDLYAAVGYGDRSGASVGSSALQIERENAPPEEPEIPPSIPSDRKRKGASGLSLDGVDDVLATRARCCNAMPGDDVVGFVTRGRGIVIHRRDCAHVQQTNEPERVVEIAWGGAGQRHAVEVEIKANDRPGLLRDLSFVVTTAGGDITSARAHGNKDGSAHLRLSIELGSADEVVRVLERLDRHPDVLSVRRVGR
jgi:GTP pyrophosphokinase